LLVLLVVIPQGICCCRCLFIVILNTHTTSTVVIPPTAKDAPPLFFLLVIPQESPVVVASLLSSPKGICVLPYRLPRKDPPSILQNLVFRTHPQAIIAKAGHDTLMLTATQDGELAEWLKAAVC
jgi:hypothetical protein